MHERLEERVAVPGCTSRRLCAMESGMLLAQAPEESMEMGKRAPSSLGDGLACVAVVSGRGAAYFVQLTTPTRYSVSTQLSAGTFSISTPAVTPSMPSYLPPVGWVSRCKPANVGGASLRRHGRIAKIFPMVLMVVWHPSTWATSTN